MFGVSFSVQAARLSMLCIVVTCTCTIRVSVSIADLYPDILSSYIIMLPLKDGVAR